MLHLLSLISAYPRAAAERLNLVRLVLFKHPVPLPALSLDALHRSILVPFQLNEANSGKAAADEIVRNDVQGGWPH
jgi:hypothetical protein